jgi:heptosyltransferase I
LARAPRRIGFRGAESRELAGVLATERVRPAPDLHHIVRRNLALLAPLGISIPDTITFPVHLPEAARRKADAILGNLGGPRKTEMDGGNSTEAPLVIVNPGAGWTTKLWAAERFGQLARILAGRFGCRVAVAWGPGEEPLVQAAFAAAGCSEPIRFDIATVPDSPGIYPLPATRFMELGAVIARARLFVGGDTGPTHLAAALGVPTVSMMGPLDARRNGPFGEHCITIQHGVPRRAPCWRNHRRWCDPLTDLRHVSVEEVLEPCVQALEESRASQTR